MKGKVLLFVVFALFFITCLSIIDLPEGYFKLNEQAKGFLIIGLSICICGGLLSAVLKEPFYIFATLSFSASVALAMVTAAAMGLRVFTHFVVLFFPACLISFFSVHLLKMWCRHLCSRI